MDRSRFLLQSVLVGVVLFYTRYTHCEQNAREEALSGTEQRDSRSISGQEDIFNGNHHDSCVCQQTCSPPDTDGVLTNVISELISSQTAQSTMYQETMGLLRQKLDQQEEWLEEFENSIRSELSQIMTEVNPVEAALQTLEGKVDALTGSVTAIKSKVDRIPAAPAMSVFHVSSPLGSYKLTFTQAGELCQSKGGVLATPAQLEEAWNKGMEACSCGWLDDGSARYPMHWPRDGCGGKNTPGGLRVCSASNTGQTNSGTMWNAYCYK